MATIDKKTGRPVYSGGEMMPAFGTKEYDAQFSAGESDSTPSPYVRPEERETESDPELSSKSRVRPRLIYTDEPDIVKERSVDDIQRAKMTAARAELEAIDAHFEKRKQESRVMGEERMRRTNSVSVLTGLAGSTEANIQADKTGKENQADIDRLETERQMTAMALLGKIRESAVEEARQSRLEARQSEEDRLNFRVKAKEEAVDTLTQLSKANSGASLEGLRNTLSEEEYDYIIRNVGGEQLAEAILFENRPQDTLVGSPTIVGGKMVQAYKTPTGRVKYESVDLPEGVSPTEIKSVQKTDQGIFIINEDGSWSKITGSGKSDTSTSRTASLKEAEAEITSALKTGKSLDGTITIGAPRGSDGYSDPGVYINAYERYPGTDKQFLAKYPVERHVNPASYDLLPESIRPKSKSTSGGRSL